MRRCISIVLLFLLPLQFSWAAMAAYCAHDAGIAAPAKAGGPAWGGHGHAGHDHPLMARQTTHQADTAQPPPGAMLPDASAPADGFAGDGQAAASGPDCSHAHCHGHVVGLLDASWPTPQRSLAARPPAAPAARLVQPLMSPPERPQWARRP